MRTVTDLSEILTSSSKKILAAIAITATIAAGGPPCAVGA